MIQNSIFRNEEKDHKSKISLKCLCFSSLTIYSTNQDSTNKMKVETERKGVKKNTFPFCLLNTDTSVTFQVFKLLLEDSHFPCPMDTSPDLFFHMNKLPICPRSFSVSQSIFKVNLTNDFTCYTFLFDHCFISAIPFQLMYFSADTL